MQKMTLKAARVNVGLTQADVAKALNVNVKTVCSWETGKSFPSVDRLEEICALYNCSYDDLNFLPNDSL